MLLGRVMRPWVPGVQNPVRSPRAGRRMIGPDHSSGGRRIEEGIVSKSLGANARLDFRATGLMPVWIGERVSRWYPPVAPEAATEFEELGRMLVRVNRSGCYDRKFPRSSTKAED